MAQAIDKWLRNLSELELSNFKIDIIYDLEGLHIEGRMASNLQHMSLINLPSLSHICVGPQSTLSFEKLGYLKIEKCNKLRFILSESVMQSLPKLSKLEVLNCEELVQIIEGSLLSKICFPELREIIVRECKSLKCLFGCIQGDTKELKDVFPKLSTIQLVDLPSLDSVCQGIDNFEMVTNRVVSQCPKISLTSTMQVSTNL